MLPLNYHAAFHADDAKVYCKIRIAHRQFAALHAFADRKVSSLRGIAAARREKANEVNGDACN